MSSPVWTSRGKTIAQLIKELQTFDNQEMEVRISMDGGATSLPTSLLGKSEGKYALLLNCEEAPDALRHR